MYKKTLVALAVAGAAASAASAADVTVYGVVDTGLMYNHERASVAIDADKASVSEDRFGMASGINAPSRFGFKGVEDLGNGVKVGFKLENGFNTDDGTFSQEGRLFGREASAHVYTDYGTVSFGRMGGLASTAGTYDVVYANAEVFDGGDAALGNAVSGRYDNVVAYQTPEFAGVQVTGMYSFKTASEADGEEGSSDADRYVGVAATAKAGPGVFVAAWEMEMYNNVMKDENGKSVDNGHTFYVGGSCDAGYAKFYALAQYFKDVRVMAALGAGDLHGAAQTTNGKFDDVTWKSTTDGYTGYGLHVGAKVPVAAGTLSAGVYYNDMSLENVNVDVVGVGRPDTPDFTGDVDGKYLGVSARYEYPVSNRTSFYVGAGWREAKYEANVAGRNVEVKDGVTQAYFGMTHAF